MTNKTLDTVRIYLQSTGGILPTERGQLKLDRMKMLTDTKQINIFAMTEMNANWNKISQDLHPWRGNVPIGQ